MISQEIANYPSFLLQELNSQRESCCYCDLIITTSNGNKFYAHRSVLAATSTWFQNKLKESGRTEEQVAMGEVRWDMLSMLLDVVYTGRLVGSDYMSDDYIHQLFKLADSLQCTLVFNLCLRLLTSRKSKTVAEKANKEMTLPVASAEGETMWNVSKNQDLNLSCQNSPSCSLLEETGIGVRMPINTDDNEVHASGIDVSNKAAALCPMLESGSDTSLSRITTYGGVHLTLATSDVGNTRDPSCAGHQKKLIQTQRHTARIDRAQTVDSSSKKQWEKMSSLFDDTSLVSNVTNGWPHPVRKSTRKKKAVIREGFQTSSLSTKVLKRTENEKNPATKTAVMLRPKSGNIHVEEQSLTQGDIINCESQRPFLEKKKHGKAVRSWEASCSENIYDSVHNNVMYKVSKSKPNRKEVMQTFAEITLKVLEGTSAQVATEEDGFSEENLIVEDDEPDPKAVSNMFDQVMMLLDFNAEKHVKSQNENPASIKTVGDTNHSNADHRVRQWKQCKYCSQFKGRKKGRFDFHEQFCRSKYKCTLCYKPFLNPMDLSRHNCKHNTKFVCDLCGRVLGDRNNLRLHQQWHAGVRSKVCQHCGRRFLRACHLQAHIAHIHSQHRPHKCPHCSATYAFKYELNRHAQKHSKSPNYMCDSCGVSFFERNRLWAHKKKEHKQTDAPADDQIAVDSESALSAALSHDHSGETDHMSLITSPMYLPTAVPSGQEFSDGSGVVVEPVTTLQEVQIVSTISDLPDSVDTIPGLKRLVDTGSGVEDEEQVTIDPDSQIVYQTVAYISSDGHLVYQQDSL